MTFFIFLFCARRGYHRKQHHRVHTLHVTFSRKKKKKRKKLTRKSWLRRSHGPIINNAHTSGIMTYRSWPMKTNCEYVTSRKARKVSAVSSADLSAFVRLLAAFCDVTTAALRCFAFASRKQPTVASDRVTSWRVARRRLISPYDVMMRWADSPRDLVATNSPAGSRSALNCHVAHIVSIAFVRSPCYRKVKKIRK